MNSETDGPDDWVTRVRRETAPPREAHARIVAGLRAEGLLRGPRRRWTAGPWLRAAAAIALFAAGWASAAAYHARSGGPAPGGSRFVFLLYGETSTPDDADARAAEYGAWARELRRQGGRVSGERLGAGASAIGEAPAGAVSLAGFFIVEAASAEAARDLAAGHPHARYGGTIVVRPVVES